MRRSVGWLAVALGATVASGCAERARELAPAPRTPAAVLSLGVCGEDSLYGLAASYFGENEAGIVQNIIAQMVSAGPTTSAGQDSGFSVLTHIASNIAAGNNGVSNAQSLTNGVLACMYANDPGDLPATFPENFSVAADPSLHGAYGVRGDPDTPDTAVLFSRPFTSPFTGIAPPLGTTWTGMLGGDPAPQRIFIYGQPGAEPQSFDWRVVPRSTTFSPQAVIGLCLDPFADATDLVHEEHIGLLAFINAPFMDLSKCSPTSALRSPSGPAQLARGLVRWGASLFSPSALMAAPAFVDGLGGTTGGVHSEFGPERVDTVTLTFVVQPSDTRVGRIIAPAVVVSAVHASTGSPVANVSITLRAGPNYGKPAQLLGTLTRVTNSSGLATFADLSETKPGAYVLTASGTVGGRPAIVVLKAASARFNVRPRDDDDDRGHDDGAEGDGRDGKEHHDRP